MKLHFENILTLAFFVVSIMILAPACSNVAGLSKASIADDGVVEINPSKG